MRRKSLIALVIILFSGTHAMALSTAGGGARGSGSVHGGAASVHTAPGGSRAAVHGGFAAAAFVSVSSEKVEGRNANVVFFNRPPLTHAEKCKVRERHFVEYSDRRGEFYCRSGFDKSKPLDCFRTESEPKS